MASKPKSGDIGWRAPSSFGSERTKWGGWGQTCLTFGMGPHHPVPPDSECLRFTWGECTVSVQQANQGFLSHCPLFASKRHTLLLQVIQSIEVREMRTTQVLRTFYNSAITTPVVCAHIIVEMGSNLPKGFLFNHTTPFSTKGLEYSLCDFTGTNFCTVWEPCLFRHPASRLLTLSAKAAAPVGLSRVVLFARGAKHS